MKEAGNVVKVDVLQNRDGRSKGCGVVEYETPEEARKAIDRLTDTELNSRNIFVREDREDVVVSSRPREAFESSGGERQYGGGYREGGGYRDGGGQRDGGYRGRGQRPSRARASYGGRYGGGRSEYYDDRREERRPVRVGGGPGHTSREVGSDIKGRQVFVGNLAWRTSWQDLKDAFRPCGPVVRAEVYTDDHGDSKGCGTVLFEDAQGAENSILEFHEKPFQGRNLTVRMDDGPPQGRR